VHQFPKNCLWRKVPQPSRVPTQPELRQTRYHKVGVVGTSRYTLCSSLQPGLWQTQSHEVGDDNNSVSRIRELGLDDHTLTFFAGAKQVQSWPQLAGRCLVPARRTFPTSSIDTWQSCISPHSLARDSLHCSFKATPAHIAYVASPDDLESFLPGPRLHRCP